MQSSTKYDRLPPDLLRKLVDYDMVTGLFTWRHRPTARLEWNTRYAGTAICCPAKSGYLMLGFSADGVKANYLLHRAAFAYVTGDWPTLYVDHINGIRTDNRWDNLRQVNCRENHMNVHKIKSPCRFKGVWQHPDTGRFRATIRFHGKNYYLGYHADAETAARAYDDAAQEMFGAFARTNASMGLLDA